MTSEEHHEKAEKNFKRMCLSLVGVVIFSMAGFKPFIFVYGCLTMWYVAWFNHHIWKRDELGD